MNRVTIYQAATFAAPTSTASVPRFISPLGAETCYGIPVLLTEMTKPKPKALPAPEIAPEPVEQTSPTMVISEATANTFMTEIERLPSPPEVKVEAARASLVKKLASSITASRRRPPTIKSITTAPPPEADAGERAEVIAKITLNCNSFEPLLSDYLKPSKDAVLASLPKRTLSDLETLLKTLEYARSVSNLTNQMRHLCYMSAQAIEMGSRRMGMKTQGYADNIRAQDNEIRLILKEIAMERANSLQTMQRPELRLALILSTSLLATDSQNRLAEHTKVKVDPEVANTFKDL